MNIPSSIVTSLSPTVRDLFFKWDEFLYTQIRFCHPSEIHSYGHCERVLLHSLLVGEKELGGDEDALLALAHAAVFHDCRRLDDYLDTGHGARAAVYYKKFCNGSQEIEFKPEAALMMKYHDIDDKYSKEAISKEYTGDLSRMLKLYDIFKDADALDRWRLGFRGLDPKFLRTDTAKGMVDFARDLVVATVDPKLLKRITDEVEAKWITKK